ncbi:nitronate monooxygenase [Glutamicibacter sp. V16R2B1]|uniref:NAD(P)H-dependent flavin oxidoreductase n=2 Tax=Micrococcaceae TaxID=1268 RepID=UPI0010FDB5BD|nr:nitronate monooxygenase [Glutamicibacter sp. V16R2B1]TLK57281.1 nitronate monooxygenase [Glutamicibacter sp. V16R2B1]
MSDLQKRLGYRYPIFNASMAGAAGGQLAAAVSTAGGVGMIGVPAAPSPQWIEEQLSHVRELPTPWGAGFMGWALEQDMGPLQAFLNERPSLVCISFGEVGRPAALARESGVLTAMQIGNAQDLQRAQDADIDIIICRGGEGGGHGRNEAGTLALLQLAVNATDKPVVAAGGIGTARGVAAALAGGAQAVWVGTRFITAAEASGHARFKDAVNAAGLDDTVYTRAFDIAQQLPWAPEFGGRALANEFSRRWAGDLSGLEERADAALRERMKQARADADPQIAPVYAGQAAAFSIRVQPAAQIMEELCGFRELLADAARRFA